MSVDEGLYSARKGQVDGTGHRVTIYCRAGVPEPVCNYLKHIFNKYCTNGCRT